MTGTWTEFDGVPFVCTAWVGNNMCMAAAFHTWEVPGERWEGIAACPEHLEIALHRAVEEDPEPSPPSDAAETELATLAATLAEARHLAAAVIDQVIGNEMTCPCCIRRSPSHSDGCPLGCLLTLFSEDGA